MKTILYQIRRSDRFSHDHRTYELDSYPCLKTHEGGGDYVIVESLPKGVKLKDTIGKK